MTHIIIGCIVIGAVFICAAEAAYWLGREKRIVESCDELLDEMHANLRGSERRASVAEATVAALTEDLAKAHRANTLLRTGILDAEREANEMAELLALPLELSSRRGAR